MTTTEETAMIRDTVARFVDRELIRLEPHYLRSKLPGGGHEGMRTRIGNGYARSRKISDYGPRPLPCIVADAGHDDDEIGVAGVADPDLAGRSHPVFAVLHARVFIEADHRQRRRKIAIADTIRPSYRADVTLLCVLRGATACRTDAVRRVWCRTKRHAGPSQLLVTAMGGPANRAAEIHRRSVEAP